MCGNHFQLTAIQVKLVRLCNAVFWSVKHLSTGIEIYSVWVLGKQVKVSIADIRLDQIKIMGARTREVLFYKLSGANLSNNEQYHN